MSAPKIENENEKVAFIIVGWNNKDLLTECFDSIEEQTYSNITTIYVDNASADGSVQWVQENYQSVKILAQPENTGFAKGNNIGIEDALNDPDVKYVVLLNSDARVEKRWVETMVNFAKQKPKGALFQGTTLDYYNHRVIDSTHIFVSHNGQGTQGNWRYYMTNEKGPKKVFGVNAAACMISRSFIESQPFGREIFDEAMFMYLEDIDLAARATILSWDNYLVPGARAYHMGSASSSKNPGFSLYMTFRNNSCMLFKNFSFMMILRILPKLIRGDIDTIRTLRKIGKKSASYKVIKGRLVGLLRLPVFSLKRIKMRKRAQVDERYLWTLMRRGY